MALKLARHKIKELEERQKKKKRQQKKVLKSIRTKRSLNFSSDGLIYDAFSINT
jgi:hypothetical protein